MIPSGGIQVSEDLLATAKAAGEVQRMRDQQLKIWDASQSLALLMHTYAHAIAMDFLRHANIPYEYKRKVNKIIKTPHSFLNSVYLYDNTRFIYQLNFTFHCMTNW